MAKRRHTPKDTEARFEDWVNLPGGGKLHLLPIPQMDYIELAQRVEEQFKASEDYLEQPFYYTVEPTEDSPGEKVLWTKRDVEASGTDEEKAAFARWERSTAKLAELQEEATRYMVFVDGAYKYTSPSGREVDLRIDEDDPYLFTLPDWWRLKYERLGIPENPYEAKFFFVSKLVKDIDTTRSIFSTCLTLAMKGALTAAGMRLFRDQLFSQMATESRRLSETFVAAQGTVEGEGEQDGILGLQSQVSGDEGGAGLGADPEPVGLPQ